MGGSICFANEWLEIFLMNRRILIDLGVQIARQTFFTLGGGTCLCVKQKKKIVNNAAHREYFSVGRVSQTDF